MTTNSCEKCEGSGIHYRPDREGDDFTPEYCSCEEGKLAEEHSMLDSLPQTEEAPLFVEKPERSKLAWDMWQEGQAIIEEAIRKTL